MKVVIAHETFVSGDAVGHDITEEYLCLKENGIEAYVYADNYSSDVAHMVDSKSINLLSNKDTILLYHHSICWDRGYELLANAECKVAIKYHNITPSYFFLSYSNNHFNSTLLGQKQTINIAKLNKGLLFADSKYNAQDFIENGFPKESVKIVPPFNKIIDFEDIDFDPKVQEELHNGKVNVLFVGRVAPNKGHKHLIYTAYYYRLLFGGNINFRVIGVLDHQLESYFNDLIKLVNKLGLQDIFTFTGKVSAEEMKSYYLNSDIFLCLSEHEGFCVPVLEAQYFNLPVIAYGSSALKDTIGQNQLVFDTIDYEMLAAAIKEITSDDKTKKYLTENGYENYLKFENSRLKKNFMDSISELK